MAASRSYFGRTNHRYLSGERNGPIATDLMFELNEFDVWNVAATPEFRKTKASSPISKKSVPATEKRREAGATALSVPVDVPDWSTILKEELKENRWTGAGPDDDCDSDVYGAENRIPPHEYLARERIASLSVHEGIGRTLKGRDLSRVRNAIWEKIGFED